MRFLELVPCRPCACGDAVLVHEPLKPQRLVSEDPSSAPSSLSRSAHARRWRGGAGPRGRPARWRPSLAAVYEDGVAAAKAAMSSRDRAAGSRAGSAPRLLRVDRDDGLRDYQFPTVGSAFAPATHFF
ncbi:hypothetical protein J5N97_016795 [Dioscorea zingiberensis]|uniref:Uncharacterized protein n=1 Tax=Dioscorea zingiberensis TaxID=325984 RepID=A0A9D5CMF4_9LILI|nr:hypothetical protein J5N97_016795 [Dioscorea zingiberensis]